MGYAHIDMPSVEIANKVVAELQGIKILQKLLLFFCCYFQH